ncbi:hypothetical protein K438DRAFT_1818744 [Mycena galopus ATCC 62051]|nr:hypothetical protein K438DRAFT_1818744 [Mycena galopus ATCC 62051]
MNPGKNKPKKPSACNPCKARRVLCHPQPGAAPCPRCLERKIICTTTAVPRGRPRKNPPPASSTIVRQHQTFGLVLPSGPDFGTAAGCPDLSPDFVAHCFHELKLDPRYSHPLISTTSIRSDIRAVSFQLHLLPPQSRVLALCIVAYGSLWSFHTSVLGDGPHPESFSDHDFFSSRQELLKCGARRAPAYRALRTQALKAAWETGTILVPSNENAASCYLLDLMNQSADDLCAASRPWATAYIAHVRALAPIWWTSSHTAVGFGGFPRWTGVLVTETLVSLMNRTQSVMTPQDQLLLCGPEPPSLEFLLDFLERSAKDSSVDFNWASLRPYLFHVTRLGRQLHDQITGDVARSRPLSEIAVLNYLDSLSKMHSILSLLLVHIDRVPTLPGTAAYIVCLGFSGVVLPFYREVQYRENSNDDISSQNESTRKRLRFLREQAYQMAVLGGREMARGLRYLAKIHYLPFHWPTVLAWAEFVAEEADAHPLSLQAVRDLETFANELKLLGYSLDVVSTTQASALIERLDGHVDQALVALFLPEK